MQSRNAIFSQLLRQLFISHVTGKERSELTLPASVYQTNQRQASLCLLIPKCHQKSKIIKEDDICCKDGRDHLLNLVALQSNHQIRDIERNHRKPTSKHKRLQGAKDSR